MSTLGQIVARLLPVRLVRGLRRTYRKIAFPDGYFRNLELSEEDIESGSYRDYLYGTEEAWRGHGAFQLHFLKTMGMRPAHTLLDVGCGPLRGGVHAIAYLEAGHYCGVDFNDSFVRAARQTVTTEGLEAKRPTLLAIGDFALDGVPGRFDFALAFSVLNHCDAAQRRRFFDLIPERLSDGARLYVTHADWYDDGALSGARVTVTQKLTCAADVDPDLRMSDWGWSGERPHVFPILEIQRKP